MSFQFRPHQNFEQLTVNLKVRTRHTFYYAHKNSYYYIPIFQQNSEIRFGDSTYEIIKLKRRTETALLYQIQKLDKDNKKILIEYQFIFDHTKDNENYKYYEDQTNDENDKIKFRHLCRIAKMRDEKNQQGVQLIRFIQLNNQHQETKIKILDQLSKEQLQIIDYNQIFVDEKFNIQIRQKQQDVSCFIQAPVAISQIIPYQQTFLIGFYHSLLNNSTIFIKYMNREQNLQQYLKRSKENLFLQQQIIGALSYNFKLQIPLKKLLQEIKQLNNNIKQQEERQERKQLLDEPKESVYLSNEIKSTISPICYIDKCDFLSLASDFLSLIDDIKKNHQDKIETSFELNNESISKSFINVFSTNSQLNLFLINLAFILVKHLSKDNEQHQTTNHQQFSEVTKILNLIRSINTKGMEYNQKNAELLSDIAKSITKFGIYNNEESESSILTDIQTQVSIAFEDFNNTIDNSTIQLYQLGEF